MGKYKFRLTDMIPNAWFYKLWDMGAKGSRDITNNSLKKKKKPPNPKEPPPPQSPKQVNPYPRKSYYFSRELDNLNSPRRSFKHRARRITTTSPKRVSSSVSTDYSCRETKPVGYSSPENDPDDGSTVTTEEAEAAHSSLVFRPELIRSDRLLLTHSFDQTLSRNKIESDIVMDLPPIVTTKEEEKKLTRTKQRTRSAGTNSPGLRLRINSPRIASRRSNLSSSGSSRSSLSSSSSGRSLAVVKSSVDPKRDFRESMVEMIVENNLRGSKDLEDLLACYLSLNAYEYHDIIIKVFTQIWFDLTRAKP